MSRVFDMNGAMRIPAFARRGAMLKASNGNEKL